MGPRNSSADERKRRTVEYRNGEQSSTNSYSNVVIPEGMTNNDIDSDYGQVLLIQSGNDLTEIGHNYQFINIIHSTDVGAQRRTDTKHPITV